MAGQAVAATVPSQRRSFFALALLIALACALPPLYLAWPSGVSARCSTRVTPRLAPEEPPAEQALPDNNWSFYKEFNNLARPLKKVASHYRRQGKYEGHIAVPFRLKLQYVACGGLCNQLLSHVHAFIIAKALGAADIVLPPAMHRPTYDSVVKSWDLEPLEGLLDVDRMVDYWKPRGLEVLKTPQILQFPGIRTNSYPPGDLRYERKPERCIYTKFYGKRHDNLHNYKLELRRAIAEAAKPTLLGDPTNHIPCVYVDIGCSLMQLETDSILGKAREAAEGLFFNSTLEGLADKIVAALGPDFCGLHLRVEGDATGWIDLFGGRQEFLEENYKGMKAMNFSTSTTVYLASGITSFSNGTELAEIQAGLISKRLMKKLSYKEKVLPAEELAGLKSEQLALLDLLVMLRASRVVGFGPSSFSWYIQELRALHGIPKNTAYLVHPKDMSPYWFNKSARFTQRRRRG